MIRKLWNLYMLNRTYATMSKLPDSILHDIGYRRENLYETIRDNMSK